jgi:biopolymer transport protein ExbD
MKLSKTDPRTDQDMDMTPMIDIVFQLIIFFMIITDMTQKELETLILPVAETASPDKPDPKEIRPIVNIISNGSIYVMGELYYDPENDDQYLQLKSYLQQMANKMPKEPLNEGQPSGPKVPANPLLIRADQSTPFKHIQKVMELCGLQGIQIWKVQLAAAESSPEGDRVPQKR